MPTATELTRRPSSAPGSEAISACETNLWNLWSNFGRAPGCELHDEGGVLWYATPLRSIPYNAVLRFSLDDVPPRRVDATIDAILQRFRRRQVPPVWLVHPSASPTDLACRLEARGLVEAEVLRAMVHPGGRASTPTQDLSSLPPETTIRPIGPDDADDVLDLIGWRYRLDTAELDALRPIYEQVGVGGSGAATQGWIARQNGRAVAKTFVHSCGDTLGVYGVACRPEARGGGLASALTSRALEAAHHAGVRHVVLHATPMAVSMYRRLGFEDVAPFRLFADPGATHL